MVCRQVCSKQDQKRPVSLDCGIAHSRFLQHSMHTPMYLVSVLLAAGATALPVPSADRISGLTERAASIPYNFSFAIEFPSVPGRYAPPIVTISGYQFTLPNSIVPKKFVSILGGVAAQDAPGNQVVPASIAAARNVTTTSNSTSRPQGPSTSNATAAAEGLAARVVTTTFSSGNSSSASGAGLNGTTITSTSSTGLSNSSAIATSDTMNQVNITTSANTTNAANKQSIQNAQAAVALTSCAAESGPGAAAQAQVITILNIPIGNGKDYSIVSSAYAKCSAGVATPNIGGSSSSGARASERGASSTVTCNGVTTSRQITSTVFTLRLVGWYTLSSGFKGAIVGQKVVSSSVSC